METITKKIELANGTLTLECRPCSGVADCLKCSVMQDALKELCYLDDDCDVTVRNEDTVHVGALKRGELFMIGKNRYMLLKKIDGAVFVVADEIVEKRPFDTNNSNDWREASLRRYLNEEFLDGLVDEIGDEELILDMEVDLTSVDGLKHYGSCVDKVALLTFDQYREHRDIITNKPSWWYLVTPYSTKENGYSSYAWGVSSDGAANSYGPSGAGGVAPAFVLKSTAKVVRARQ